jgi:hypothetical protein
MHAPPACDGTSPSACQPAAKRLAVRPPLHTLDPEELIRWAREYGCVEEKGLASVVRACREAGLDGAALCGVPNVDALRETYKIGEWGVRTRLMEMARSYRRAAEQQGTPAGTEGGAAAAAEGSRRSRAAELSSTVPSDLTAPKPVPSKMSVAVPGGWMAVAPAAPEPSKPKDVGAVVQALLHRTPTTSPPWPVRCLCFRRTVGTSSQLSVRA